MAAPCPTFGFHVVMESTASLDAAAHDELRHAWIAFLEHRGLYCAGGGGPARMEYVVISEASQGTENDRVATRAWLASRPELRAWEVGELVDLEQDS
jgi:uncharacterized protein YggL (DUF469 family)